MAKKGKRNKKDESDSNDNREQDALAGNRALIIETWKARDELYKSLFGKYTHVTPANYSPPPQFPTEAPQNTQATGNFWSDTADPGDPNAESQHLAVLAYEPDPLRPYWTYITAGLCTPWLQDRQEEVSGFGMELMIKAPTDSLWPPQILRSMAFYIFNHAGTLTPGVRIGLNESIVSGGNSKLRNLLIWYADEAPDAWYQLPSGGFGIFTAIGITDDELKFGESIEEYGTWCIQQLLRQTGSGQVTDPNRPSVMEHVDIEQMMSGVRAFAHQFREHSGTFDPNAP
jgi:Suppressor of fused protein (SUFU)